MRLILVLATFVFSSVAWAGKTTGVPSGVGSWEKDGKAVFAVYFSASDINTVACNTHNRYLVTSDNPAFETITAVLLAHYAAQQQIIVVGSSACNDNPNGNSETLLWTCSAGNMC